MRNILLFFFLFSLQTSPAISGRMEDCQRQLDLYKSHYQYLENEDMALIDCHATGRISIVDHLPKNIFSLGEQLFKMTGQSDMTRSTDRPVSENDPPKDCTDLDLECAVATPLPSAYSEFLVSVKNFIVGKDKNEKTPEQCACIKQRLLSSMTEPELKDKKKDERKKINKLILEAYGRKFLNDFSLNLEDASFFLTKNRDMFKDPVKAKGIQCNDPEALIRQSKTSVSRETSTIKVSSRTGWEGFFIR